VIWVIKKPGEIYFNKIRNFRTEDMKKQHMGTELESGELIITSWSIKVARLSSGNHRTNRSSLGFVRHNILFRKHGGRSARKTQEIRFNLQNEGFSNEKMGSKQWEFDLTQVITYYKHRHSTTFND
jgi:hypothetical protein